MPNGKQALIRHVGSLVLTPTLTLECVLHVPEFHFNLLSISRLTSQIGVNVLFTPTACILQDHTSQTITLGKEHKGLYFFHPERIAAASGSSQISKTTQQQTNHTGTACFPTQNYGILGLVICLLNN